MSGPYINGLGRRKRKYSKLKTTTSEEEVRHQQTEDENSEIFFSSDDPDTFPTCKRRRVTPTDAELIPKFQPDLKNSNVAGWIHKIDQLGDIYGWNHKDRQFIMQIRLRGSARDWYDDLDDYDLTWKEWKNALQTAFPRSTDYVDKLEQMLARVKEDKETMTKYYHEKLSLLKKCNITGEDAISCIIRGLPAELRINAKAYNCGTPEQLYYGYLSSLENYKRVAAAYTAQKSTWRRGNTLSPSTTSAQQQLQPKICYACRRAGHEARDCWQQQRCEICRRSGHTTANCWHAPGSSRQQHKQGPGNGPQSSSGGRGSRPMQDGRMLPTFATDASATART
ncbi:uncharacterized protein LOC126370478 [Pectinophora gossypiella]|uniref:uncharacterized protein LOC126370478 n=1 Tax=Pectinophora gossypiella TaxID=13191 RepID=UPI00214E4EF0|nr:uncharacterized protein LOC126370478 [Pectinophora gossypiella]